jgi:dienelactone hydrolase
MRTEDIEYRIGDKTFTGYLADGSSGTRTAGVLVAHEGGGMTGHPKERARMLAQLGYAAFAMDTFGEAIRSRDQAMAHVKELMNDLPTLRARANAALAVLRSQPNVVATRVGAIGFCFGGTTVLELARGGAELSCVVGFHAGLQTSAPQDAKNIRCPVLICTGTNDPIVNAEHRDAFAAEMTAAGVDWRMILYGGVGHSFTNREIDAHQFPGFLYDERADQRSWRAMLDLFDETLRLDKDD